MACKVVQRRIKKLGVRWVKVCNGVMRGFAKAPRGKKGKR